MIRIRPLFASLAMLFACAPLAQAADAENGLLVSQRWCASCHIVSPDQKSASADVPSFQEISLRRTDAKALSNFLTDPHPRMPGMELSRDEIADIVRYIQLFNPNSVIDRQLDKDDKPPEPRRG